MLQELLKLKQEYVEMYLYSGKKEYLDKIKELNSKIKELL